MEDLLRPNLPRMSAAISEPTLHGPDVGGHFGMYGGRFVAEALMAVIEEVTAAYEKARERRWDTATKAMNYLQAHPLESGADALSKNERIFQLSAKIQAKRKAAGQ